MTAELEALEASRLAAIAAGDTDALRALLTEDYVHVHMTGARDDREGHLRAVAGRPRRTEAGDLTIRAYGDLAVITGDITNHMQGADPVRGYCTRVAVKGTDGWRYVSCHLTRHGRV